MFDSPWYGAIQKSLNFIAACQKLVLKVGLKYLAENIQSEWSLLVSYEASHHFKKKLQQNAW
jgi:hypothetical protein